MRIEILDPVHDDFAIGFEFYQGQSPGLGIYFLDSVFSDIDSLLIYAGIHPVVHGSFRCLASRFPFAIYYRLDGEIIRVQAVLDCRRDSVWIRKRITESVEHTAP